LTQGVGAYLGKRAEANGLIVRPLGDSIAFSPPLVIAPAEIEEMLESFGNALEQTWAWVKKSGFNRS
jgi:4-aminobutyrate--pyruvate transaminase